MNATPSTSGVLPAGAAVTFYQTLSAKSEVPYAIDEVGIDPFNPQPADRRALAAGTIDYGHLRSNGGTITMTSSTPVERARQRTWSARRHRSIRTRSTGTVVQRPATTRVRTPPAAPRTVTVRSARASRRRTASVPRPSQRRSPRRSSGMYNQGALIVSHNGAVIGTAALDAKLCRPSGAGTGRSMDCRAADAVYYLSAIVWNSANPRSTHASRYESVATPVNLSGGSATATVTIN